MSAGKVKIPASAVPVTLSTIGGDPDRSRTIKTAGNVEAKDTDELRALLSIDGAALTNEPDDPAAPATPQA